MARPSHGRGDVAFFDASAPRLQGHLFQNPPVPRDTLVRNIISPGSGHATIDNCRLPIESAVAKGPTLVGIAVIMYPRGDRGEALPGVRAGSRQLLREWISLIPVSPSCFRAL
jgi:hypothetical protein